MGTTVRAELGDAGRRHITRAQGPRKGVWIFLYNGTSWWDLDERVILFDFHVKHKLSIPNLKTPKFSKI